MKNDFFANLEKTLKKSSRNVINETNKIIDRAFDKHICIGITGFSGSGKSTFITSLIHHLRYSNESQLYGFIPARDNKILDVQLKPLPGSELFDYEKGIDALSSDPPQWPPPTSTLSGCVIEVGYKRSVSMSNKLLGDTGVFRIEIRDYPGEWLLDLPLLEQDYWSWCQDQIELNQQAVRSELMGDLLPSLQTLNPFTILTNTEISHLFEQYTDYLQKCKQQGLTLIQPGRFLLADTAHTVLPFFPLLNLRQYNQKALEDADEHSLYKVMEKHYLYYVNDIVLPFRDEFFNKIDRQVVLIDALKALSGGKDNFDDMMVALSRIMDSYHYGINSFINKLTSPDIERIVFLASKPDGILSNQHENLRSLVGEIVMQVCPQSVRNIIPIDAEVACAVRCTIDHNTFLTAISLSGQLGQLKHPIIPEKIPTDKQWQQFSDWKPIKLQAPVISGLKQGARLPSIRMDTVLKNLIGDKF